MIKIVAISDTHNEHNKIIIPECDILIHAGDESGLGREFEIRNFAKWLDKQSVKHIIWTPGNHSVEFANNYPKSIDWFKEECPRGHILLHDSIIIENIKIFASPWTPFFLDWAYNAGRTIIEAAYYQKPFIGDLWKDIPEDTEILITHGPPYKILDELVRIDNIPKGEFAGCQELSSRIQNLKKLKHHFFGHIHYWGGQTVEQNGILYHNVSICDEMYLPKNKIIEIEYKNEV